MTNPVSNPTGTYTQYDNAKEWFGTTNPPQWIGPNGLDQDRIRAYMLYERIYWNVPSTMSIVQRGDDALPVYLPTAKGMVEACNRFLEVGWDYNVDTTVGNATDQAAIKTIYENFFIKQKVYAKHARQKRYGLIRGDKVWHITANDAAPKGNRVYLHEVQPEQCFPILKDQNPDWIIGFHLVDLVPDPRDETKQVCRRQTYRKVNEDPWMPSTITSEVRLFELGKWDDRVAPTNPQPQIDELQPPYSPITPVFSLPADIVNLPVYLIPNQKQPCQTFGSSEVRGIETVIRSINQTVTDEDLTLAVQGLGVYTSTAGPPVGQDGTAGTFDISPGSVVEVPEDANFTRVSGVQSGLPGIEHMNFVIGQMQHGVGVPDIAAGTVDVTVAESGIALLLQLSPLLAKNAERETEELAEEAMMFDDLTNGWFVAYEGFGRGTGVVVKPKVQSALPQDRAARFSEIIGMVTAVPPVMSVRTAIAELNKIGYDIPADEIKELQKEAQDRSAVATPPDAFNARVGNELGGNPQTGASGTGATGQPTGGTTPAGPGGAINGHAARTGVKPA
jgi:hypothetical protein